MHEMGLVHVYGGTSDFAVIDLPKAADPKTITPMVVETIASNAEWLGRHAVNNKMVSPSEMLKMLSPAAINGRRAQMDVQRFHAGQMEIACLVYAYAMEHELPEAAHKLRNSAREFGSMASFLSDADRREQFVDGAATLLGIVAVGDHRLDLAEISERGDAVKMKAHVVARHQGAHFVDDSEGAERAGEDRKRFFGIDDGDYLIIAQHQRTALVPMIIDQHRRTVLLAHLELAVIDAQKSIALRQNRALLVAEGERSVVRLSQIVEPKFGLEVF